MPASVPDQAAGPGDTSGPVPAHHHVGASPVFVERAQGAYVFDVSGRGYVDLVGSRGAALLGHARPEVVEAVRRTAARGIAFSAPAWGEVALAEEICRRVSACQKVRFVSTGTEAAATAARLARAATGRDVVVAFAGCRHGRDDDPALPTVVVGYNDLDAVTAAFARYPGRIAAVITEPAAANMGVVPPRPGFNAGLRRLCTRHGALLVFDEALTGFRVGPAGWWGLEVPDRSWWPDLFVFGRIVGGGMPLTALAGRAELMDMLAPLGPVRQAGALSGNPLATAAGLATLRLADDAVYRRIGQAADRLATSVRAALNRAGVPHRVQRAGSLLSVFWGEQPAQRPVEDYAAAQSQDRAAFGAFCRQLLAEGVMLPSSAFEAWFVSAAHDEEALGVIEAALPRAAEAAARASRASSRTVSEAPAPTTGTGSGAPAGKPVGKVTLVGGGPGDPELITLAGLGALRAADVVLYDHLAPPELLRQARPGAELVDVGKLPRDAFTPQDEINRLLVEQASAGRDVVRLKGGDVFVFGRGGEECQACLAAGVPVSVIPGVTSAIAGPALAGIPVTQRGISQGFTVVSAHVGPDSPASTLNWDALAHTGTTLVVLMGVHTLRQVCDGLISRGMPARTAAAIVQNASRPDARIVTSTLGELAGAAEQASIASPAVTVIGPVAALHLVEGLLTGTR